MNTRTRDHKQIVHVDSDMPAH